MDVFKTIRLANSVGIFGYGVTGRALEKFCKCNSIKYKVFDENKGSKCAFTQKDAAEYKVVVRSPSFLLNHEWVQLAQKMGCTCVTELDFAYCFWHGKIAAITGTNGKTTTTEFLTYALNLCGQKAVSCGNIGVPFIDVVNSDNNSPDYWAIIEVSSFQMNGAQLFSPDFVLWTNFADDHLDVHSELKDYFDCKSNLIKFAKNACIDQNKCFVGPSVATFANKFGRHDIEKKCTVCSDFHYLPDSSALNIKTQRENFALIQKFWETNNFPIDSLQKAAVSFQLPPHRLQKVADVVWHDDKTGAKKCVQFWDDSKATNFHALNGALQSFDKKVILLAGGKSKNESEENFFKIINGKVKFLLLFGETGEELYDAIAKAPNIYNGEFCELFYKGADIKSTMFNIVKSAFLKASDGDIVLLSPGFSSLDWFKSYADRGKFFKDSILCLNLYYK